jgi:hypothetical protein
MTMMRDMLTYPNVIYPNVFTLSSKFKNYIKNLLGKM